MSIIDDLIYDRTAPGRYDWRDYNRVTEAMEYLVEELEKRIPRNRIFLDRE